MKEINPCKYALGDLVPMGNVERYDERCRDLMALIIVAMSGRPDISPEQILGANGKYREMAKTGRLKLLHYNRFVGRLVASGCGGLVALALFKGLQ